jgi:3'(2'), 5'-bisphosphate nucleotidase
LLSQVIEIAREAGTLIKQIYLSEAYKIEQKADLSPLTIADTQADDLIVGALTHAFDELVISEETYREDNLLPPDDEPYWLVDPLDGTKNFVEREDTFAVSIARVVDGVPQLGVIYAPMFDEMYSAEAGKGAFLNGEKIFNSRTSEPLIAIASRSELSERAKSFYEHFKISKINKIGSAIKFGRIARGEADLYARFGETSEWDIAAGHVLLKEAGCKLISMQTGLEMDYGKPGLRNRGFLASRLNLNFEDEMRAMIRRG